MENDITEYYNLPSTSVNEALTAVFPQLANKKWLALVQECYRKDFVTAKEPKAKEVFYERGRSSEKYCSGSEELHAVTDLTYSRAHDLVVLQVLWRRQFDLAELKQLCVRTFSWRKTQAWPPLPLRDMSGWESAYLEARTETMVDNSTEILGSLAEARRRLAQIIAAINNS